MFQDLEDDSLAMKDDPQDEDFESQGGVRLRRGKKRASATRFNEQMALFVKRKRGRPPTITDPVTCSDCGETFTVLKDFRLHCVSADFLHQALNMLFLRFD